MDKPIPLTAAKKQDSDPLDWIGAFTVDKQEVATYEEPDWCYPNLIIEQHIVAWVADPGAGKTTVATHVCGELTAQGYKVLYVLADIGRSDIKHYHAQAEKHGWELLLPDVKVGLSMADVVDNLARMNAVAADYTGVVFIFDTLKKCVDVINKRSVKEFLHLLRQLTAKGMTIVLLGHTNKYKGEDGEPIFEGTHDVKTDVDDLLYLIPREEPNGFKLVQTKPSDKVRGSFKPITFRIHPDRSVTRHEVPGDLIELNREDRQFAEDRDVIDAVKDALEAGKIKQLEIIEACKPIGEKKIRRILKRYSSGHHKQWTEERAFEKNTLQYFPLREKP